MIRRKSLCDLGRPKSASDRVLTFKRSVEVDREADLLIGLVAKAVKVASWGTRTLILAATLLMMGLFVWAGRSFRAV